jgi:hypothetical protein
VYPAWLPVSQPTAKVAATAKIIAVMEIAFMGTGHTCGRGKMLSAENLRIRTLIDSRWAVTHSTAALEQITDILGDLTERSVSGDEHAT